MDEKKISTLVYGPELYTKKTRVWIKHPIFVWQCAEVKENFDKESNKLIVITQSVQEQGLDDCDDVDDDSLQEKTLIIKDFGKDLPPLRNPDILIGSNDLTSLSYLHEPSVLYNLRVRFLQHQQIYTWCGIVLVAINPFTDLEIYGEETIQMYHSNLSNLAHMDPHIYAVAEDAFTKLECSNSNQSVIVSGESGAGKTVSAKFAMRYFASIAGSDSNIEARVLASNPIMEAIGNAKTVRNDNSSRFGKYIQIMFDRNNRRIMGGNMRTYLLEKSRVVYQSEGERNFHIFYQLCSYAKKNHLDHLDLCDREFFYLGTNEKTVYDDMSRFLDAMDILNFDEKHKNTIFLVIASILHGGNIFFASNENDDDCMLRDENSLKSLQNFCRLLGLNESSTLKWLTSRLLKTGAKEIITTPLNAQTAQYGLEALLKFIYEKMFHWIVSLINHSLGPTQPNREFQFIGVLDIYGFEHFEINSFEQFCINYANEVLQQQFNWHVFKLEQDEYIREGIDWQFISFTDNQLVIDLIETKPIGILCLLDEECRMPQGTDATWCSKLYKQIPTGEIFKKPKFNYQSSFIIEHFADQVTYTVSGFLEKNRDTIWGEQIELLKRSSVANIFFQDDDTSTVESPPKKGVGGRIKIDINAVGNSDLKQKRKAKATIGFQFRESLEALMQILNSTEPHYVRCIKPNDRKAAFEFNNIRAVQQLRACGVLETIRISSNGYPSRWSYHDFASRYRILRIGSNKSIRNKSQSSAKQAPKPTPRKLVRAGSSFALEIRQVCEDIVRIVYEEKIYSHFNLDKNENESQIQQQKLPYQFGKTKIFFKPGQVALLERIRSQKLKECAILMQKLIRGWLQWRKYQKIRTAALAIQRYGRGWLARKNYEELRRNKAAIIIQSRWKGFRERTRYDRIRSTITGLQNLSRGYLARQRFQQMRRNRAAIIIQKHWRGYNAKKRYQADRRKIILAQACIRRHFAKKEYRRLRIEARSVKHVTNLNRGLEKKIIELQQRINQLSEENFDLKQTETQFNNLKNEMEQLRNEMKSVKHQQKLDFDSAERYRFELDKLQAVNLKLTKDLTNMEEIKMDLEKKIENLLLDFERIVNDNVKIKQNFSEREEALKKEHDLEIENSARNLQNEILAKQELLSKCMDLEARESNRINPFDMPMKIENFPNDNNLNSINIDQESNSDDFYSNTNRISLLMKVNELEQELQQLRDENSDLRALITRNIDSKEKSDAYTQLTDQLIDLRNELTRLKKERSDLKRVILTNDRLTTFNGDLLQKAQYEKELVTVYQSLLTELDNHLAEKDRIIEKLKNEKSQLKLSDRSNPILSSNVEATSIDRSKLLGMYRFNPRDINLITRYLFFEFKPTNTSHRKICDSHSIASIAYMCLRYLDHISDEKHIQIFMKESITCLKKAATLNDSLESLIHSLACLFKFSIYIKYYSEDDSENRNDSGNNSLTEIESRDNSNNSGKKMKNNQFNEQSEFFVNEIDNLEATQSLKNFDLTNFNPLLKISSSISISTTIESWIVAAVLENQELSIEKREQNSDSDSGPPSPSETEIQCLFRELSNVRALFSMHQLDERFVFQFFDKSISLSVVPH
ncbi:Unconventional myosin-Vb [Sarcoptes scabiei]|uniref:Unconventional myosin-Vb n=1 Tax=Sarcoptes scabiei TaxID=52283 RepID=A0A834R7T5_SARSC|nr:Unconventional myosin-Vb [Sarcoptes scabiei]